MQHTRQLGSEGPRVSAIGYGAMGLEGYYGAAREEGAHAVLQQALDMGCTFIDSADAYGNGHNEQMIGRALAGRRDQVFVATKFGIVLDTEQGGTEVPTGWEFSLTINGRPNYARRALEGSLKRLDVSHLDLWYLHFPDPDVPIEETIGAMSDAVDQGKVRYIGLSNVTVDQVRRAHGVHPISAVQYEYSLWRRGVESDLLPALRELGIALVPWSPLGSGFLTGTVETLAEDDFRNNDPRYQGENLTANKERFAPLMQLAAQIGVTPAQLSLAWLLHQGPQVIAIPGTRSTAHLRELAAGTALGLSDGDLARVEEALPIGWAQGDRYSEAQWIGPERYA